MADAAPSLIFVPELGTTGDTLELDHDESHYVAHVCRARAGETVWATDGRGRLAELRLVTVGSSVTAEVEATRESVREREAVVWCGAPEGTRADWLVEKLAELGVGVLQPIDCARARWEIGEAKVARLTRLARSALRQSRTPYLMRIESPRPLAATLESIPAGASLWVADPNGPRPGTTPADRVSVGAVGPSPGFDEAERRLLEDRGFQPISLGGSRLRTETAAMAWAAWWASGEGP